MQLKKLTGKELPEYVLAESLTRLEFTDDPIKSSLLKSANDAYDLGFLAKGKARSSLDGIYDLTLLNQVLGEKGLPTIDDDTVTITTTTNATTITNAPLPDVVS
jgi:NitT/TauT family transport system substrate-binding protein